MGDFGYLCFPISALLVAIVITLLYFNRQRVKSIETTIYKGLAIINLLESITACSIVSFALAHSPTLLLIILNKIDYILIFSWICLLFAYVYSLNFANKKIINLSMIINTIVIILIIATNIEIVNENGIMNSFGLSNTILFAAIIVYLLIIIGITIYSFVHHKTTRKKYIPMVTLLIIIIAMMILRLLSPQINMLSFIISFINLIMFFTIENPDVKMLEKIEIAKEQADKANRAKTDFLSSMSHEIRTPLNAIVGFSDYIMSSESLEEAKENAQDIVHASKTLLEIVNGILDISKIEAGKLEIVNSKYKAKETFEGLAKLVTPKMNEKGLDFSYYIAPDLPETLFGDHANLKKIVTNLLSNAYKYTEKGSVRYEVNCINSGNISKLIITVEDTGRGIKQESIDKLFTKFQRLDEDRNTTIEGTGLGLAITKQLIELMGGKILVHTVYGEGSKFTVILNQNIEKTEVVEEKVEIKTTLDLKDKKILLVDDNSLNIKVANKILERFNANDVTSLDNGFDCIDLIKSGKRFDIILMDDMMPKMSGVETFHKLKELPGFDQPVVILTANAITGMKEKYLSEGFEDYLAKPIEKDELIRVCNTVFTKYPNISQQVPEVVPVAPVEQIEESSQVEPIKQVEEVELIEPIEMIEEIEEVEQLENTEELEIIGEETIEPKSKEEYLKSNGVDLEKAIELLGDIEMYDMTISDFLSEVEEKWQNIITYKTHNDMENYAIEVHSLKSDAKYLGFMSLADISYQHELKSKENDSSFVNENFTKLEEEYNKALNIAKTYNEMSK